MDLLADMNISYTFNIGYLTLYIEDEDEGNEYLRANPLQGREVDVEQVKQSNLLNHIKALVRIGPVITFEQRLQEIDLPKSLLIGPILSLEKVAR